MQFFPKPHVTEFEMFDGIGDIADFDTTHTFKAVIDLLGLPFYIEDDVENEGFTLLVYLADSKLASPWYPNPANMPRFISRWDDVLEFLHVEANKVANSALVDLTQMVHATS